MKAYVAGKFEDKNHVRALMSWLRKVGVEITVDWTTQEDSDLDYPVGYACEDLDGVRAADVFIGVFVLPYNYRGALVELGIALGLGKPVYVIGSGIDSCIFVAHPKVVRFSGTYEFKEWWLGQNNISEHPTGNQRLPDESGRP